MEHPPTHLKNLNFKFLRPTIGWPKLSIFGRLNNPAHPLWVYNTSRNLEPILAFLGLFYFCCGPTQLTLEKAIAYKLRIDRDRRPDKEITKLSEAYIPIFGQQLKSMLEKEELEAIRGNIKIV